MCGITGFYIPSGFDEQWADNCSKAMRIAITHRGPDDSGEWVDGSAGIAIAHQRLSIIDISAEGHQPMVSNSGRFVICLNGEIYNYRKIRSELEKLDSNIRWKGHSDTEVLLAAVEHWGLEAALKKAVGMFALALWDRQLHHLELARDRMGEKPLYYGWQGNTFLFGSELKALQTHPDFNTSINQAVLPLYFRYGYIPAPWTIWQNIYKLLPGTILRLTGTAKTGASLAPAPYWTLVDVITSGKATPFSGDDTVAIDYLEAELFKTVKEQMVADVPLGAFLSGGIDSSTVVALMQAQSSRPVKTFTIGFTEAEYNEAEYAQKVARHLGTDHTQLYVSPAEARSVIPQLPVMYDEPFGDSSAIPTFLVSQLARSKVIVSLSGDGGDELFGGYGRYFNHRAEKIWQTINALPLSLKNWGESLVNSKVPDKADKLFEAICQISGRQSFRSFRARADMADAFLHCSTRQEYYQASLSQWHKPPVKDAMSLIQKHISCLPGSHPSLTEPVEQFMYTDQLAYLPDDILVKVDRAAMAVSLETRVPLLNHRLVSLAWQMPYHLKVRNGQGKWLLRKVLERYVPRHYFDRPKMGFGVPVDQWLRGPLREWAEDHLNVSHLKKQGLLNPEPIWRCWCQHVQGRHDWSARLWLVLMFQAWYQSVLDKTATN
jgi:asparagine synthase (glutamine-hydrolysing)